MTHDTWPGAAVERDRGGDRSVGHAGGSAGSGARAGGHAQGSDVGAASGVETAAATRNRLLRRSRVDRQARVVAACPTLRCAGRQLAYDTVFDTMLATTDRRDRLDTAIAQMAADSEYTPVVTRMGCLRGVSTLTAFALAVEIGDWHRLTGRSVGAYVGLVPSESSSGRSRAQGPITKTGNGHVRRLLVEAAWHHRTAYRPSVALRRRWDQASPAARARGHAGNRRLHARWQASTNATNASPSPMPRSPANSPAGAGRWRCSRTDSIVAQTPSWNPAIVGRRWTGVKVGSPRCAAGTPPRPRRCTATATARNPRNAANSGKDVRSIRPTW